MADQVPAGSLTVPEPALILTVSTFLVAPFVNVSVAFPPAAASPAPVVTVTVPVLPFTASFGLPGTPLATVTDFADCDGEKPEAPT